MSPFTESLRVRKLKTWKERPLSERTSSCVDAVPEDRKTSVGDVDYVMNSFLKCAVLGNHAGMIGCIQGYETVAD